MDNNWIIAIAIGVPAAQGITALVVYGMKRKLEGGFDKVRLEISERFEKLPAHLNGTYLRRGEWKVEKEALQGKVTCLDSRVSRLEKEPPDIATGGH